MGRDATSATKTRQKQLGAYYTDETVAQFITRWALVNGSQTVLDPSFGGGVFLMTAARRVCELGGDPSRQVTGVEIDPAAFLSFSGMECHGGSAPARVVQEDFFAIRAGDIPAVDAVVGNPPFIRYQRFTGDARKIALRRASEAGVPLSGLASAWAAFVVHAVRFIKLGGSLAMVIPEELLHASYSRPLLSYLQREFRAVQIITFARRLFPRLSEGTILLMASGRGLPFESMSLVDLPGIASLAGCRNPATDLPAGVPLGVSAVVTGAERVMHYLIPEHTRRLYGELSDSQAVCRVGEVADVGIGYVSGDNEFFHPDQSTIDAYELPQRFLRPAIRSGSDISGLRYRRCDWQSQSVQGRGRHLLLLPRDERLPQSVTNYLAEGVRRGVPSRYKCRVRNPWYTVPHVHRGDAFLTYMSGSTTKLVENSAGAVAPNSLHLVRLKTTMLSAPISAFQLATLWQTSLTGLSAEMEGHSLGGGMLKLEPTEAESVLIAHPKLQPGGVEAIGDRLDALLRCGEVDEARRQADRVLLCRGAGLTSFDVDRLHAGWSLLRQRRLNR